MATIEMKGIDEYLIKLSRLEKASKEEICGKAIYEGAKIVADSIKANIQALPTDDSFGPSLPGEPPLKGPTQIQKQGLLESFGITTMQDDGTGFLNVKLGFDGYNAKKTKKWPNGQPNQMIARSVQSGTSFMKKHEFVKKAVASSRKKSVDAMGKSAQKSIEEIMK